jgi:RNA polymerase sigma-70 factor (ECF subfamily)
MGISDQTLPTRPSLLLRLRSGQDQEAWSSFVAIYAPAVHRFLLGQGVQEADALDVAQEVLVAVAADIGKFEHRGDRSGSFRKWLFTIVRNRTTDHWRREWRQPRGTGDSGVQMALSTIPAASEDFEEQWNREYLETIFHTAANQVKTDFQAATWQAFWRTTVEDESPQAVAADTGLSLRAVYLAKRRVLQRIQKQIEFLEGELI